MSEGMKHTRGEWIASTPTRSGCTYSIAIGNETCPHQVGEFSCVLPNDYIHNFKLDREREVEHRANAHLIAALPRLLSACEVALEIISNYRDGEMLLNHFVAPKAEIIRAATRNEE